MTALSASTYWILAAIALGIGILWMCGKILERREREEAARTAWRYLTFPPTVTALHKRCDQTEAVEQMLEFMQSSKPGTVNIKELINTGRR